MIAFANTLISIYPATTTTDEYGDEVESDTPLTTDLPASLIEGRPTVETGADGTPRAIRTAVLRVRRDQNLARGRRVKDQSNGMFYIIDSDVKTSNLCFPSDLKIVLRAQRQSPTPTA